MPIDVADKSPEAHFCFSIRDLLGLGRICLTDKDLPFDIDPGAKVGDCSVGFTGENDTAYFVPMAIWNAVMAYSPRGLQGLGHGAIFRRCQSRGWLASYDDPHECLKVTAVRGGAIKLALLHLSADALGRIPS